MERKPPSDSESAKPSLSPPSSLLSRKQTGDPKTKPEDPGQESGRLLPVAGAGTVFSFGPLPHPLHKDKVIAALQHVNRCIMPSREELHNDDARSFTFTKNDLSPGSPENQTADEWLISFKKMVSHSHLEFESECHANGALTITLKREAIEVLENAIFYRELDPESLKFIEVLKDSRNTKYDSGTTHSNVSQLNDNIATLDALPGTNIIEEDYFHLHYMSRDYKLDMRTLLYLIITQAHPEKELSDNLVQDWISLIGEVILALPRNEQLVHSIRSALDASSVAIRAGEQSGKDTGTTEPTKQTKVLPSFRRPASLVTRPKAKSVKLSERVFTEEYLAEAQSIVSAVRKKKANDLALTEEEQEAERQSEAYLRAWRRRQKAIQSVVG